MRKSLLSLAALAMALPAAAQLSYEIPATLSYYGTIEAREGIPFPAANYCTTNPVNDGALIWVPAGSKVMYQNTSETLADDYSWVVPGAATREQAGTSIIATYDEAGTYDFPTLVSGDDTFALPLKIKVGGRAELCHSDTREWGATYALGYAPFGGTGGYLGGSNTVDIAGVGNFYRFSSADMYVDGMNIYTGKVPENPAEGAAVQARVYLPYLSDDQFSMIGLTGSMGALEGDNIPMTSYKTIDDEGVYLPARKFAVYHLDFTSPLSCDMLPYLFMAVEGFQHSAGGSTTEDFVLATDVAPARELAIEDYTNAMAHNSFVRMSSESDYMRPVSVFGGSAMTASGNMKSYNFWICPLVRGAETPLASASRVEAPAASLKAATDGARVLLTGAADGTAAIYATDGTLRATATAANGGAVFDASSLAPGIYVARAADGASVKFAK